MLPQEVLQEKQAEARLRSSIRTSKQKSKNRLSKVKPAPVPRESQLRETTKRGDEQLLAGYLVDVRTDARSACYLFYVRNLMKQGVKEFPTFKEFFAYVPPPEEENEPTVIQIREPNTANGGRSDSQLAVQRDESDLQENAPQVS